MSEQLYIFHCRSCETHVVGITAAYCDAEGTLVHETRCPICERSLGISIDAGTLELGLVRDSVVKDRYDYELFADPPPG